MRQGSNFIFLRVVIQFPNTICWRDLWFPLSKLKTEVPEKISYLPKVMEYVRNPWGFFCTTPHRPKPCIHVCLPFPGSLGRAFRGLLGNVPNNWFFHYFLPLNLKKIWLGKKGEATNEKVKMGQEFYMWSTKERARVREANYSLTSQMGEKAVVLRRRAETPQVLQVQLVYRTSLPLNLWEKESYPLDILLECSKMS